MADRQYEDAKVVGINASKEAVDLNKQGKLLASGDYSGFKQGCIGVMAAVRALRGEPVPKDTSLKTEVVTAANYQAFDVAPEKLTCPSVGRGHWPMTGANMNFVVYCLDHPGMVQRRLDPLRRAQGLFADFAGACIDLWTVDRTRRHNDRQLLCPFSMRAMTSKPCDVSSLVIHSTRPVSGTRSISGRLSSGSITAEPAKLLLNPARVQSDCAPGSRRRALMREERDQNDDQSRDAGKL